MSASTAPAIPRHGRGARPEPADAREGRLVAVRLREHDLLVRGRVGRDRAVADRRRRGSARRRARRSCRSRSSSASASTRSCRRSSARSRIAAAGGCRSCSLFTALCIAPTALIGAQRADRRRAPVHRRELLVPGRAHLLRRVAQAREHAGDARPAVGHRDGDRVLRHGVRRAADLLLRHPGRGPLPARGACCSPCSRSRSSSSCGSRREPDARADHDRATSPASWAQLPTTIAPRPRGPGPAAVPGRPVLLLRRGQHRDRRHERRRGGGRRASTRAERTSILLAADRRGDRDVVRVGRAGGPASARARR